VDMMESRVNCALCKASLVRRASFPLTDEKAKRKMSELAKLAQTAKKV